MTSTNAERQRRDLLQEKARLLARIEQIDAELAARALSETVQEVLENGAQNGHVSCKNGQVNGGDGWIEERFVNGCGPYRYRRWWDGKRKRSQYLGKGTK